ncbi:hypothetical protein CMV_026450 [Castanea mollissima]|uniref:BED-type domain-containing protein n=1 Tax=Castanea mollissima TaxID=60419 RepID=A0A8J4V7J7_9ROSI|nr:hypothetical protein CMV_026450 [Castanea mollissima]
MGRGRDPFWAHAEKVNGCLKFKCNYCKRDFAGGASRIKAHLAGVSGHDIVACNTVPPDVQNQARATQKKREALATQGTNKKLKSASTSASKLKNKGKEEYMAEIVLNDVVDRLIATAFSLATDNIGFESSFKVELKNLLETLFKIKFLLDDAQKRQSSDESVRIWLMKLRDVAYDADNVLDEFSYESFWQEVQTKNLMVDQVRSFSFCNPDKVKTIKQLFDKIVHDVAGFGLRMELVNSIPNISSDMNIDPLLDDSEVVGREYDVTKVVNVLISSSNQEVISVLPILGMAGLGKTTLAKLVYNNELIKKHFDVLAWVNVGLSNSIEQLIHLRFLHIFRIEIKELPKSITKLYNLQTLRIEKCPSLMELPEDLSDLINLRHICIIDCESPVAAKNIGRLTRLQTLSSFCVGRDEGYRMKELEPLKNLKGEINIYNLEKVEDEEEAKSAKLKEKEIFNLGLFWSNFGRELDNYDNDEKVLEGLHPHPNLKSLKIQGYQGKKFPSWVNDLSLFHNLIHIKLNLCTKCEEVPTLGHLPHLRVLKIFGMLKVRSIGSEFYSYSDGNYENTTALFPSLRVLKLEWMNGLEHWKDAKELTSAGEVLLVFPCLEELIIRECHKLRGLPDLLHTCVSLHKLVVKDCPVLRSLPGVPPLIRHLEITDCGIDVPSSGLQLSLVKRSYSNLKSIPESLHSFIVRNCPKLSSLPGVSSVIRRLEIIGCGIDELPSGLQFCTSLQYLKIGYCPNLKSIPESLHNCVSLQNFVIQYCPLLSSLRGVPSVIQHLTITKCGIDELPSGLRLCTSLQYLGIEDCLNLKSIPESLHTCVSLQKFVIQHCSHLSSLPGVPSVIQHLEIIGCGIDELPSGLHLCTSLQYLKIKGCPNLKSIPESLHTCVSLQKFVIQDCTHLISLRGVPSVIQHLEIIECSIDELPSGLQFCTSLQYLKIEYCRNLKSIPDLGEVFHSLIKLKISNCADPRLKLSRRVGRLKTLVIGGFIEELDAFPILRYPFIQYSHASLKKLILLGRPTLNSLPNEIQLFTALEELQIEKFNGMEALPDWLSDLSSLQKLSLYFCEKLMYLPILHLTNLKHLRIDNCRNLEERCAEGSGAEWFQIGHVPNIRINGKYIQGKNFDVFDSFGFDGSDEFCFDVFDDSEDDYVSEDEVDDSEDEDRLYLYMCEEVLTFGSELTSKFTTTKIS